MIVEDLVNSEILVGFSGASVETRGSVLPNSVKVASTETRDFGICEEYSFMLECPIVFSDSVTVIVGASPSVNREVIIASVLR
jgi:hypothetical protein